MQRRLHWPPCPPVRSTPVLGEQAPQFLYLVGDCVYFNGETTRYYAQFHQPYEHYPAPIFAVPGNHDGENLEGQQSLDGFVRNFCAATPGIHRPEAQDAPRTAMTVPTSRPYSGRRPLGGRLLD
jgi:hypothetical protein